MLGIGIAPLGASIVGDMTGYAVAAAL